MSLAALVNSLRAEHQRYLQELGAHMEMQRKVITMDYHYLEDNPLYGPLFGSITSQLLARVTVLLPASSAEVWEHF